MQIGNKIKQLRTKEELTQTELANQLFVSRQTISNWENNKSYPSIEFIESISEIFNVSIDDLVTNDFKRSTEPPKIEEITKEKIIETNKYRVVLNRFLYFRWFFIFAGSLITSYFYFSSRHLDYIWLPILSILFGLSFTLPIKYIQNKYQLNERKYFVRFLDELYD